MSSWSLLSGSWKKLPRTPEKQKQLNRSGHGKASQKKKKFLVITLMAGLLLLCQVSGLTNSGWTNVKKFFSVVNEILSEFTFNISRNINDTKILIWTRKAPLTHYILQTGDRKSLINSNFNKSHPTKILIHGFSDNGRTTWIRTLRKQYFEAGDFNIISIDWELLAESPWYTTAAKNAKPVGKFAADFIWFLVSEGVSFESMHILGASLGAQVAGYVGYYTEGRLARITGLDPSGPLFHTVPACDRLDSSDAQFVDVIHTAGKWVGNDDVIGHVDFFPNLGRAPQPGCEGKESLDLTCSHFKAWKIYAETIQQNQPEFYALRCDSAEHFSSGVCCHQKTVETVVMGERTPNSTRGIFYLVTNRDNPHVKPPKESVKCNWIPVQ